MFGVSCMILINLFFFSWMASCDLSDSFRDRFKERPSMPACAYPRYHFSTVRRARPILSHNSETLRPDERPNKATLISHFRRSCDRCQLLSTCESSGLTNTDLLFALGRPCNPCSSRHWE